MAELCSFYWKSISREVSCSLLQDIIQKSGNKMNKWLLFEQSQSSESGGFFGQLTTAKIQKIFDPIFYQFL